MKKIVILLFIIMVIIMSQKKEEEVLIPKEALRFRIIANSNDEHDQIEKIKIRDEIEPIIVDNLKDAKTLDDAKRNLEKFMPVLNKKLESYNVPYQVNLGLNYFPEKEYKGVTYEEGNYDSLVITLGNGLGDNWWCVLFPPLCLLEAEEKNMNDIEYQFYIKNIIDKL